MTRIVCDKTRRWRQDRQTDRPTLIKYVRQKAEIDQAHAAPRLAAYRYCCYRLTVRSPLHDQLPTTVLPGLNMISHNYRMRRFHLRHRTPVLLGLKTSEFEHIVVSNSRLFIFAAVKTGPLFFPPQNAPHANSKWFVPKMWVGF